MNADKIKQSIRGVSFERKPFDTRKKFFNRIDQQLESVWEVVEKYRLDLDEYERESLDYELEGLNIRKQHLSSSGICDECLKFTSVYKGASYGWGFKDFGTGIEESFTCPRCLDKARKDKETGMMKFK